MRIVIIGNYGARNMGDEAVLSGILELLHGYIPRAEITVLSYNPKNTERQHHVRAEYLLPFGVRSFLKFHWWHTIRVLKQADYVLLGGGALFTDEKIKAMYLWGYHAKIASRYCSNVILFAHTIGPLKTRRGIEIMKKVLRYVKSISVRDKTSKDVIDQLDPKKDVILASDPAFLLNKNIVQKKKKQVVLNLRPWIRAEKELIKNISVLCDHLIADGYTIVLLPFQTFQDDDRKILQKIYHRILNKNSVQFMIHELDLNEIMQTVGESEFVIGMRLHSLVVSIIQHVPFIALSYSEKISNMLADIGWGEYNVDMHTITDKKMLFLVHEIEKTNKDLIKRLEKISTEMRNKALFNLHGIEK